jgi:CRP-like cAMP-binding protein
MPRKPTCSPNISEWIAAAISGLVTGAITIIASVSLAALIFRGNLSGHLADGINIALVTAALTGLIVSLTGSSSVAIAIPQDRTAPILAIMAAAAPPNASSDQVFSSVVLAIVATTIVTSLSCSDWDRPEEHLMRMRSGSGTLLGEIGFYLGTRCTASVITNGPSKAYRLTSAALKRMEAERPELAAAPHRFIADLLAERLLRTTQTLEAVLD